MQETWVWSLGQKDTLEKEMVTYASILVWSIQQTEEPSELQSMGSQRVRHDWETFTSLIFNWRITALQCCVGFCHPTMWISRKYTCISSFLSLPPTTVPHPTPLGCHRGQTELSVLYSNFSPAINFTHLSVYISMLLSQFVIPSPLPDVCFLFSFTICN